MAILHHLPMRSFNMTYRKNMQLTTSLLLEIAPSVQTCSFATGKLHTINYLCHFKVMTHFRISDTYSIFRHDIGAVTILGSENCQSISFQNLLSAIIFHRYHEKDITKIRGGETCRSIVGYDANDLYLWALMQDMPTGWYTRIGKLPVDGWCAEARTAYQFHGCFFHGCPKCYDQN